MANIHPVSVAELTAIHARIRLRRPIRHASFARRANDTLLIRCRLTDGSIGWGEGLPRPYVTGETIDSAWSHVRRTDWSPLAATFSSFGEAVELMEQIRLERPENQRECFGNAVRCAVELAVLDALGRSRQRPIGDVIDAIPGVEEIRSSRDRVCYSAAVTATSPLKGFAMGVMYRALGFRQCKAKVGTAGIDDVRLVRSIRRGLGSAADLRVDANEAWEPAELPARIERLRPFGLSAVEQPVPHSRVHQLAMVKPMVPVAIVLDESLCCEEDARRAIGEGLCDLFNIRLSKCGGLSRSIRLAVLAHRAGMGYQLGCQVGECGILSAAGRHLAAGIFGWRYLEGSFDRYLVRDRLTEEDLTFEWGGWAPVLRGPGLGITVDENAVQQVTVERQEVSVGR